MSYTPGFTPQYEDGWENLPLETTPIIAQALNGYDEAIEYIEDYLENDQSISDLKDVDLTGLQNGNTLIYDNGAHKFKPGNAGSGGANRFVDLNDVTITDPTDGEPIVYQNGSFVNGSISVARIYYGECASNADVQHKVVTVAAEQQFRLKVGAIIFVKFSNTNQYSATANNHITLNVNSTGDKPIYAGNTGALTGINITYYGRKDFVNQYVYDGTYWVWCGSSADNNSVYVNREALSGGVQTSLVTTGEKYIWNNKADTEDIPTKLSDLEDDSTHRLVTDTEKTTWNAKSDVEANPSGTATGTLTKIDIDGDIYNIEGGGGGNTNMWTGTQAEYEQQASQIEDGTLVNITDDADDFVDVYHEYSTTEKVVGKWIDGSTVYEKTVSLGGLANNDVVLVSHGITNLGVVVSLSGTAVRPASSSVTFSALPIPYPHYNADTVLTLYATSTSIGCRSFRDVRSYTQAYATIRYTKTS